MAAVFRAHGRLPNELAELTLYQLSAIVMGERSEPNELPMPERMSDEEIQERLQAMNG